jgi:hypothetical protein
VLEQQQEITLDLLLGLEKFMLLVEEEHKLHQAINGERVVVELLTLLLEL